MDIGKLKAAETGFLHLTHPATGEKLNAEDGDPVGIELAGMYSAMWRNKLNQLTNKKLGKKQKQTAERSFEEFNELFAAVTVDVKNLEVNGTVYTPQNIVELYGDIEYGWIRNQVNEFLGDDANFF